MGVDDSPHDLTPFITRTTRDHVSGGGFGDVWKCNYNADGLSTVVAIKAFRYPEQYYDSERINRKISREIGILTILRHKNIVPLLGTATGFGRRSELRSLVTPWIPNGTLSAYLASNHNNLTLLDRSRMLEDVSAGLQYLHSVDIMHGDITGANILIDEGGQAKLIDFGLSTIIRPLLGQLHLVATSIRPGQIRYAAPELVLSEEVHDIPLEKTDIYSFGCVMLQILSGQHPWFEIKSDNQIVITMSKGRGPQRPDRHPTIMDSDWDIIQRCLQFRPELRPSADEVLDFVMRRISSSDSSSPLDDPPDDVQGGFPGATPHYDSDDSNDHDLTEHTSNNPPCRPDHELTSVIIESGAQRSSSCSSVPSLGSIDSRVARSAGIPGPEQRRSVPQPLPLNASSSNRKTQWVVDDASRRLLFKGRRLTFISDVPNEIQITLFLTLTPDFPGRISQAYGEDQVLSWKVLHIGPGKRQEVVHIPSRRRTGDPGFVVCTLNDWGGSFEVNEISLGAAREGAYECVPSDRPGICVKNKAPHDVPFALAIPSDKGSADPFLISTLPRNCSRQFTGSMYIHAFRTIGVTPGSQHDLSDREFLTDRITEENGCEVSRLGPTTYWYVYQSGDQLKVKIGKSPAVQPDEGDEEDEEESVHSEYNRVRSQPRFSRYMRPESPPPAGQYDTAPHAHAVIPVPLSQVTQVLTQSAPIEQHGISLQQLSVPVVQVIQVKDKAKCTWYGCSAVVNKNNLNRHVKEKHRRRGTSLRYEASSAHAWIGSHTERHTSSCGGYPLEKTWEDLVEQWRADPEVVAIATPGTNSMYNEAFPTFYDLCVMESSSEGADPGLGQLLHGLSLGGTSDSPLL
jgi:serine/threonine protein kinase